MSGSDDQPPEDLVADLHGHLEATAELPVDTRASRWLGEAEAVARDAVGRGVDRAVIAKRVEQVEMLLSNVEGTGDETADEHVARARELVEEIQARL
ncbi:hypothetical protein BRC82_08235 [Halobacteriales archaeon QS_1_67_19]|nr:MAG: hypothetical protein BRC82_08235 [Halobacteriales archaeon QS_1_67_19]